MTVDSNDIEALKRAKDILETPGLAAKITHLIGKPIEMGFAHLPARWNEKMGKVTRAALEKAVHAAVFTMDAEKGGGRESNLFHKTMAAFSGGLGGFFGMAAMAVELPISTTIMLRSVADVARSYGEDIRNPETKIACMEVFAMGGPGKDDDAVESGYFAVRTVIAQSVARAAEFIAEKGLAEEGAPALSRLIVVIAERFSVQVSEKTAAQFIPLMGAAGGALVNTLFIRHFQDMAMGHFSVRRLERKYGADEVKRIYLSL